MSLYLILFPSLTFSQCVDELDVLRTVVTDSKFKYTLLVWYLLMTSLWLGSPPGYRNFYTPVISCAGNVFSSLKQALIVNDQRSLLVLPVTIQYHDGFNGEFVFYERKIMRLSASFNEWKEYQQLH